MNSSTEARSLVILCRKLCCHTKIDTLFCRSEGSPEDSLEIDPEVDDMASNIDSRKAFSNKFPDVRLDVSVHNPTASSNVKCSGMLDYEVLLDWLSGEMGCQLKLTQHITQLSHEKSRYFYVYEVLKSFARFSQGRLLLQLKNDEIADQGLLDSGQVIHYERRLAGRHKMPATIEFIVVNREEPDNILLTIEVKENIANEAYLWQTLAELISASDHKDSGTCAALTDAFNWRFFESKRENDCWVIHSSRSLAMFDLDLNAVETTNEAFSLVFSHLFPGQDFPDLAKLRQVNEAAEQAMKRAANVLALPTARGAAQLAELNARLQKEVAEKEHAIAKCDELQKQLRESKKQRTE